MSKLLKYREELNLTQKELSEKSGISIRTIQRIESGSIPKGYTLKKLAIFFNVPEKHLITSDDHKNNEETITLKLVNFSTIFFFVPGANIILPLLIMQKKKLGNKAVKQLISVQILWTLSTCFVIGMSSLMVRWMGIDRQWSSKLLVILVLMNLFIILRNAIEIQKKGIPFMRLSFSFL
jgi:transcriptional regulator with XRE-family HTH domain